MPDFEALFLHVFCGDYERRTEEWRRNSNVLFKVPRKTESINRGQDLGLQNS